MSLHRVEIVLPVLGETPAKSRLVISPDNLMRAGLSYLIIYFLNGKQTSGLIVFKIRTTTPPFKLNLTSPCQP